MVPMQHSGGMHCPICIDLCVECLSGTAYPNIGCVRYTTDPCHCPFLLAGLPEGYVSFFHDAQQHPLPTSHRADHGELSVCINSCPFGDVFDKGCCLGYVGTVTNRNRPVQSLTEMFCNYEDAGCIQTVTRASDL